MAEIDDLLNLAENQPGTETREQRIARREEERAAKKASKTPTDPSYIMDMIGNISGSNTASGLTPADFLSLSDLPPINVGTYSGKTFSAPIFATGGMLMNFGAIRKAQDAKIAADNERKKKSALLKYDVYEVTDALQNEVLINKQAEAYDKIVEKVMAERGVPMTEAKRYLNEEGNDIIKKEGREWKNFSGMLKDTNADYLKVLEDETKPPSQRIYSDETLELAKQYTEFIANPDNFDYDDLPKFAGFYGQFKESIALSEWATGVTADFKVQKKDEITELGTFAGENVYGVKRAYVEEMYGRDKIIAVYGDPRWSEERKNMAYELFLNNLDRDEEILNLRSNQSLADYKAKLLAKRKIEGTEEIETVPGVAKEKETSVGKVKSKTKETMGEEDETVWKPIKKEDVVELGQNKKIQISLYGAIDKSSGEKILETKDVYLYPMDSGFQYTVKKQIGEGVNRIDEGEFINKETKEGLINVGLAKEGDFNRTRYVEGTIETIEPLGSDKATVSIFIEHDKIREVIEKTYPGTNKLIQSSGVKKEEPKYELNNRPIILKGDGWYYEDGNKEKVK